MTLSFISDYASHIRCFRLQNRPTKLFLLLPEGFDFESEVNSDSLSINYGVFCVLSKPVIS